MDKEKEIEEFAKKFCLYRYENRNCKTCCSYLYGFCVENCPYLKFSEELINAGYGNIKQAVKEFAEYAKQVIVKQFSDTEIEKIKTVGALQLLYNKIEELYGAN